MQHCCDRSKNDFGIHGSIGQNRPPDGGLTMTTLIPKELIERAKLKKACSEAIEWLSATPRTWIELAERSTAWCDWAVENLATPTAGKSYYEALAPLRKNYLE